MNTENWYYYMPEVRAHAATIRGAIAAMDEAANDSTYITIESMSICAPAVHSIIGSNTMSDSTQRVALNYRDEVERQHREYLARRKALKRRLTQLEHYIFLSEQLKTMLTERELWLTHEHFEGQTPISSLADKCVPGLGDIAFSRSTLNRMKKNILLKMRLIAEP